MATFGIFRPPLEIRELSLLQELERNPVTSQRELANKFGIALGVTNACLRKMAQRGWIEITELDHHKNGYYLTPEGLAEKMKLTLNFISWTVRHYSRLKQIIERRFLELRRAGIERIVFYGVSDEMEIAYVALQTADLKLVGIFEDEDKIDRAEMFGFQLKGVIEIRALDPDAILITSLVGVEEKMKKLESYVDISKVKVISL